MIRTTLFFALSLALPQDSEKKEVSFQGKRPPELTLKEWRKADGRPTLASLTGSLVFLEFWATW